MYRVNQTPRTPQLQCHIRDCHENGDVEVTAVEVIDCRNQLVVVTGSSDSSDLHLSILISDRDNANEMLTMPNGNQSSECILFVLIGNI